MATHSPKLILGTQKRVSLPNTRKKSSVLSSFLVGAFLRVSVILRGYSLSITYRLPAERRAQEQLTPVYQQRREALKGVPKFWPVALLKHSLFALQAQHDADRLALSYLEDVWVVRDPREPKVFTLEFVRFV
jgi:Nucleosome assembly protein (NAP)